MQQQTLSFFDKVYDVAKQIPYGRVTSFGAIANYLGASRSARMVGYAMNGSHHKDVPAHRVVNRKGLLTGKHHFEGTNLMQQLLESEGIEVDDDKNFNKCRGLNIGFKQAITPYVVSVDADCIYSPDFTLNVVKELNSGDNIILSQKIDLDEMLQLFCNAKATHCDML